MTIDDAAKALHERVHDAPWYTAVGIGAVHQEPCLFLYVKFTPRQAGSELPDRWMGYPVEVRKMGAPQPAW